MNARVEQEISYDFMQYTVSRYRSHLFIREGAGLIILIEMHQTFLPRLGFKNLSYSRQSEAIGLFGVGFQAVAWPFGGFIVGPVWFPLLPFFGPVCVLLVSIIKCVCVCVGGSCLLRIIHDTCSVSQRSGIVNIKNWIPHGSKAGGHSWESTESILAGLWWILEG